MQDDGLETGHFKGDAQPAAAQICRQHVCDLLLWRVIALFFDGLFVGLFVGLASRIVCLIVCQFCFLDHVLGFWSALLL